ncbi:MAG: RidA family protein [Acidimicrobiales bacterium]|jgi:enamine deaminase RidA (YjgF/YER057c/UK114 family)
MTVELIRRPAGLGEPLGRYSHVSLGQGVLVAVAGQVGLDAEGRLAGPDLTSQARQAYANLGVALAAAGCGFDDVLRMNTYLVSADLVPEFMEARAVIFSDLYPTSEYPPNTLAIVSRLVEEPLLFEVEALAVRSVGDAAVKL